MIVLGKSFARFLVTRNYSSLHSVVVGERGVCVGVGVMMVNQMLLRVLWLFLGFDELMFFSFLLLSAMLLADAAAAAAVEDAKSTSTT